MKWEFTRQKDWVLVRRVRMFVDQLDANNDKKELKKSKHIGNNQHTYV